MKKHKQYITEWKSVNDEVKFLSNKISRIIWNKSLNERQSIDPIIHKPFIQGNEMINMGDVFGDGQKHFGLESIDAIYKIYLLDDVYEYNKCISEIGNSEYNSDENTLYIRGAIIEGYFNYTITQEIYHELNHSFEYGMGMEKRVDLYDKVVGVIGNDNGQRSEMEINMCKLVYYTFTHEQDAFAHQFYGLISSEQMKGSFEELVGYLEVYNDFKRCRSYYKNMVNRDRKTASELLRYLGMTFEDFNKRIHFGGKRLYNKLYRVYLRHSYEMSQVGMTFESMQKAMIGRTMVLSEYRKRYKNIDYCDYKDYIW